VVVGLVTRGFQVIYNSDPVNRCCWMTRLLSSILSLTRAGRQRQFNRLQPNDNHW